MAEISWVIASLDCLCSVAARSSSCHSDRAGSPPTRGRGAGGRPSLALPRPQPICAPGLLRERPCLPFPVPSLPWRAASRSLRVSVGERQTDKARAWAEVEPWGSGAGGRLMRPQRRCWRAGRGGARGSGGQRLRAETGWLRRSLGDPRNRGRKCKSRPGRQRDRQSQTGRD